VTIRRGLGALAVVAFLSFSGSLLAQTIAQETVRFGVLADWPPYYSLDDAGRSIGFAPDIVRAVCRRANLSPQFKVYANFPAMIQGLQSGDIDAIANFGVLDSRDVLYTSPVSTFGIALFVRSSSSAAKSIADVPGKIGVVRSNVGVDLVGDHPKRVYPDVQSAIFGLLSSEVDGLVYPAPVIEHLARQAGVAEKLRQVSPLLKEVRRAIAVNPKAPQLYARLSRAVDDLLDSPEYRQIYLRWNQPRQPFWTLPYVIGTGLLILLLVSAVLLMWRFRTAYTLNRRLRYQAQLLEIIDGVLVAADVERRITYVNSGAERLTGWQEADLLGEDTFRTFVADDSKEDAWRGLSTLLQGERWTGELNINRRGGDKVPVMVSASPIVEADGRVSGIAAFAADLSNAKHLELQLMHAQRMEALGRLAGGIAHDFNNVLTVIKGEVELAMEEAGQGSALYEDLRRASRAADSASSLTRRLLVFSKQQPMEPKVIAPAKVLEEFTVMLKRLIKESVALNFTAHQGVWPILIDRGQLEQMIMNLVVNANDALPSGGNIGIDVANVQVPDGLAQEKERVCIKVTDDGMGMDRDVVDRAFEPFFSTKPSGLGTGLGLSIVHGIVHQSGGNIAIDSTTGLGTTVTMQFPRSLETPDDDTEEERARDEAPRGKSIMVVEDEAAIRHLIRRVLGRDDYTVTDAGAPLDALEMLDKAIDLGQAPDLLITDFMMPEMTGAELATRVHQRLPEIPVLFLTGYTDETITIDQERDFILLKPFKGQELRSLVKKLLVR